MGGKQSYTKAKNFVSATQQGVDPRTGLFGVRLPLANLQANALRGPNLSLNLVYVPLSDLDIGFGKGFRLNLSGYDPDDNQLILSSGGEYRTDKNDVIMQQKLKDFRFIKIMNANNEIDHYEVIYKNGVTEKLRKVGKCYVTTSIHGANGRSLKLTWNSYEEPARLFKIEDDDNVRLCTITYAFERTIFWHLPNDEQFGTSTEFRFMHLNKDNEKFEHVSSLFVIFFFYKEKVYTLNLLTKQKYLQIFYSVSNIFCK